MPWTGAQFKSKHWKDAGKGQAEHAASMANAMMRGGTPEGEAIATAIARTKNRRTKAGKLYGSAKSQED